MPVKKHCIQIDIIPDFLIRIFHAVELVLSHLRRVPLFQNCIVCLAERLLFCRVKGCCSLVVDKRIVAHHMAVAKLFTAVAEIIFLPVAPPEGFGLESPTSSITCCLIYMQNPTATVI